MAKRVCSCHRTQCFQGNSRSDGGRGERKEGRRGKEAKKKQNKKKTTSLLATCHRLHVPCLLVAGCRAESQSEGLNVAPVQTHGGVTAEDETLSDRAAVGATRRP